MDPRLAGLVDAAKQGNPLARTNLAHAQALGLFTPRNLNAALDNLALAASVGWPDAVGELQVLARTSGNWRKLRAAVNPEALRRAPSPKVLLQQPRLRVFEGFATPAECDWLIEKCRHRLKPAQVYEESATALTRHEGRSNSEAAFEFDASDVVLSLIRDRTARASGIPVDHFEVGMLLHYKPGETFGRHTDFLQSGMHEEIEVRGQRVATFLTYLSDDYDGGETEFPEANFKFKARKGDALMFLNVDAEGAPDPMSLHAGLPTTRGEKWVLSQWLRGKPVNSHHTPGVTGSPLPLEWYQNA